MTEKVCDRFRSLAHADEAYLSREELSFLRSHAGECRDCRRYLTDMSLLSDVLRSSALDHRGDHDFADRVEESVATARVLDELNAWRPAMLAALTAAAAILTVLHVLTSNPATPSLKPTETPTAEVNVPLDLFEDGGSSAPALPSDQG
jgi:hypothetical protein